MEPANLANRLGKKPLYLMIIQIVPTQHAAKARLVGSSSVDLTRLVGNALGHAAGQAPTTLSDCVAIFDVMGNVIGRYVAPM